MSHDVASLKALLSKALPATVNRKLARIVPQLDLGPSPNWLYTSGKPNRYNPTGIQCVYFGETRDVAQAEYDEMWAGLPGGNQPATTFHAQVSLARVLDLTDGATLTALKITTKELFSNWRTAKRPTVTQLLGQAVNETELFSAIRYPSKATATKQKAGVNFVIFHKCVKDPDSVQILGPTDKPLQKWP